MVLWQLACCTALLLRVALKRIMMSQKRRLQFVFSDFYVAALCNLGFTICGSYIEQVWSPLIYRMDPVMELTPVAI